RRFLAPGTQHPEAQLRSDLTEPGTCFAATACGGCHNSIGLPSGPWMRARRPFRSGQGFVRSACQSIRIGFPSLACERLPKLDTISFRVGDPAKLSEIVAFAFWIDRHSLGR